MNITTRQIQLFFIIFLFSLSAIAAQVSQQQIEQFKKMPKAQQEMLAKSMGVDLDLILGTASNGLGADERITTPILERPNESSKDNDDELSLFEEDAKLFKPLERFGVDVFSNAPATFSPTMDIAIPENYILGVGDQISIQVYGKENAEYQLAITREGHVIVPDVGPIKIAGLSFSEMKSFLSERIKQRVIGVNVVVSLGELRSMRIFVLGEAYKPGPYTLSSLSSVTHAIFAAGGVSDIGSLRNIEVKRAGKLIKSVDLYELLINGDSSSDILLQSGDVVFIPAQGQTASILGEVRRPAIYELKQGDDFNAMLAMSGGMLASAYPQATVVERYNARSLRSIVNVDLSMPKYLNSKVKNGDYIRILKSAEMYEQSISVIGAAARPGKYEWKQGIKVSDLLPSLGSHILPNADLNYSIIVRQVDDARNIEVLQFSLENIYNDRSSNENIVLNADDKILIFSNVNKSIDEASLLDEFAFTQEQLFAKEREQAKTDFKEKSFWKKYGGKPLQSTDNNEEQNELLNKSLMQITEEQTERNTDIREMALFSRQRLLAPVLRKLRQQGASGAPVRLVEVDGQIKFPGIYPLAKNGTVRDLVLAGGGVNESAYLSRAEITRNQIDVNGASKLSLDIDLGAALNQEQSFNIALKSKDRLNIHKIPAWSENHIVELRGEFVFPGKYTIRRGETLADLIIKAGGFTKYAHLEGSVFTRQKLKELERKNFVKLASDLRVEMASKSLTENSSSVSYADAQKLLSDITELEPIGRLVLNLPNIINNPETDILLENGDILSIPTKKDSVNVIGQVQVSSSHIFDNTMNVNDYIMQSGGIKKRADEERIYVISANGGIKIIEESNWFSGASNKSLKAGDTIVVPLDSEYMNDLTLWSTATQIVYNAAVAVAAINGI